MNRTFVDHGINQAVGHSFRGRHEEISVRVLLDAVQGLTGSIGNLLVQTVFQEQNFIGLDADVTGLTLRSSEGLVNHDPGVPKAAALSFGASTKQKSTHAGCKANAHGVHIRLDVLHGVENAETCLLYTSDAADE